MVGYLTLPIRLLGILLMAAFCLRAMEPLRFLEVKLANLTADPGSNTIATVPSPDHSSWLLSLGLGLVAIISIWLIYQTWRQHIALAEGKLRIRRAANSERQSN